MKKRVLALLLGGLLALSLCACSGGDNAEGQSKDDNTPPDLTGVWTQKDAGEDYQQATISGDTITVNWVSPDSTSLYWAGTFTAPTTADEPYTWTSENDTAKTSTALLAATSETKDFTYQDGKISYEVSAFGTTTTVELERTGDAPVSVEPEEVPLGVTIDKATIISDDYTGDTALAVQFTFTNTSDETTAPEYSLSFNAYQNGVQLQSTYVTNSAYDLTRSSLEVQPGGENTFWMAYELPDETAAVDVSVKDFIVSSTLAEKTFDITALEG